MTRLRTQVNLARLSADALREREWGLPRVSLPVDVTDEEQFPEIALARRGFNALPPEERRRLNDEWED